MKAAAILAALILPALASPPAVAADSVGQYTTTVGRFPTGAEFVLILDTKNGYVWKWEYTGGSRTERSLVYQGQVIPENDSSPSGDVPPR